jgi:hypothetical protein
VGEPLALVWNYAIHGTTLGPRNLHLSGDVMGEASARLERDLGAPVLFVNGAVGDVSPGRHGERATAELGAELAAAAQAGWAAATLVERPVLQVGHTTVTLPPPRLSVRNCLQGWAPRWLTLPLGWIFPGETTLTAVAIAGTGWVTLPGELQTSLGRGIKKTTGLRHTLLAGLSNDYLGYFVAAADYQRPTYVSCGSVYGPQAGSCLAHAAAGLLGTVARGGHRVDARVACDREGGTR